MGCRVGTGQRDGAGRGKPVVRDVGTQRGSAPARATVAASEEPGQALSPAVGWAELAGVRILRSDDAHGHEDGRVVQHDEIRWADLLDLALFSTPAVEALGHPRPTCAVDGTCGPCRIVRALGRIRSTWLSSGMSLPEVGAAHLAPDERTGDATWTKAPQNQPVATDPRGPES